MTHAWPIRVYYEDTDMAGIVYHANYLKFCERARSEMVRAAGIDQATMRREGVVFAVVRMVCDFRRAAAYDDELLVRTEVCGMTAARFEMAQTVCRGAETVFEATVTVACLDARGRPVRLPETVRALSPR